MEASHISQVRRDHGSEQPVNPNQQVKGHRQLQGGFSVRCCDVVLSIMTSRCTRCMAKVVDGQGPLTTGCASALEHLRRYELAQLTCLNCVRALLGRVHLEQRRTLRQHTDLRVSHTHICILPLTIL